MHRQALVLAQGVSKTPKEAGLPNLRSKQGSFSQACRGTSRESDVVGGEKTVKDALQRVFRHDLDIISYDITGTGAWTAAFPLQP
ncbi:hypothetical protein CXK86_18760 [Paenibacillus sp. BGI2013]|nr:hypothetical protein CXK86_18760 [Paenibacillus sp. BGI2013]